MSTGMRQGSEYPTKFRAEKWTDIHGPLAGQRREEWAVIMLGCDEANWPCAFGSQGFCESYAAKLNEQKGILV